MPAIDLRPCKLSADPLCVCLTLIRGSALAPKKDIHGYFDSHNYLGGTTPTLLGLECLIPSCAGLIITDWIDALGEG